MLSPSATPAVLRARNHPSLACRTRRRSLDVRTSLHNFPTESYIETNAQSSTRYTRFTLRLNAPHAVEALPDVLLLSRGKSWSLVTYYDMCCLPLHLETNPDRFIGCRVLEGVGQVVAHHLHNAIGVGLNWHRVFTRQFESNST